MACVCIQIRPTQCPAPTAAAEPETESREPADLTLDSGSGQYCRPLAVPSAAISVYLGEHVSAAGTTASREPEQESESQSQSAATDSHSTPSSTCASAAERAEEDCRSSPDIELKTVPLDDEQTPPTDTNEDGPSMYSLCINIAEQLETEHCYHNIPDATDSSATSSGSSPPSRSYHSSGSSSSSSSSSSASNSAPTASSRLLKPSVQQQSLERDRASYEDPSTFNDDGCYAVTPHRFNSCLATGGMQQSAHALEEEKDSIDLTPTERVRPLDPCVAKLLDKEAADRLTAKARVKQALASAAAEREQVWRRLAMPARVAPSRDRLSALVPPAPPAAIVEPPPVVYVHCGICQEEIPRLQSVLFARGQLDVQADALVGDIVGFGSDAAVLRAPSSTSLYQCAHRYCRECIRAFLEHEITDGKVLKIRCPGRDEEKDAGASASPGKQCVCLAPKSFVARYTDALLYDKYERFLKLKQDDSYRTCPNADCLHVQQKKLTSTSDAMVCEQCRQQYCFRHDLAHAPGTSCSDYEKQLRVESAQSLMHIEANTVRCPWPTCRVKTIKASGCNHVSAVWGEGGRASASGVILCL